ncbi:MAG TPA: hypothetical protein VNK96_01165 [Fimbriimonadales bacterium]|nr:hypothetical protein [Fimbriimonadales bacterium]
MFGLLLLSWSTLQQSDALEHVYRAHESLNECAIRVAVEAKSDVGSTSFEYEIWRAAEGKFRIDLNTPAEEGTIKLTILGDANRVFVYSPKDNQYNESARKTNDDVMSHVSLLLGGADPFMEVYLEPKRGLKKFLGNFIGVKPFRVSEEKEDEQVFVTESERSERELKLLLRTDAKTHLLKSFELEVGKNLGAKWTVSPNSVPTGEALQFEIPKDAKRIEAKNEPTKIEVGPQPIKIESEEARAVIDRSRKAYEGMKSVYFHSLAKLTSEGNTQTRLTNCWWEKGGRLRYAVSIQNSNRSFEAFYDNKTLTAYYRTRKQAYKGNVSRKGLMSKLDSVDAEFEPLVISLIKGENYWERFESPGAVLRLLPESVSIGNEVCNVIEAKTTESFKALIYIREKDGLILRIDRNLEVGKVVPYQETVTYEYKYINKPIPSSAWKMDIPKGIKVSEFPKKR